MYRPHVVFWSTGIVGCLHYHSKQLWVSILGKLIWHYSYCSVSVPRYRCKSLILKGKHVKTIVGLFQRQCIFCYLSFPFITWHTYLIVYWHARKKVYVRSHKLSPNFLKLTSSKRSFFCFNRAFKVQLITFFIWRKNCISFSRFLCFSWIHKFNSLWRHGIHYCILENMLFSVSFEY